MTKFLILFIPILFFYFIAANSMLLNHPKIWPDEVYLADVSGNILNYGEIKTNLWGDIFAKAEVEKHFYWYPPVYLVTLASWFKLFGFSVVAQRYLSILTGGLFITLIYFLVIKELNIKNISLKFILVFLALTALIIDNNFLKAVRIGRPDILVLLLGTFSIFLYQSFKSRTKDFQYAILGLICGITALVHFIGAIFFMAILIDQLFKKRLTFFKEKRFLYLLAGFVLPLFIWIISIYPNYYAFLKQLSLQRHFRRIVDPHIVSLFRFEGLEQKVIFIIYILVSIINISFTFLKRKYLILSLIVIGWAVYVFSKLEWYTIYFVPFLFFSSALLIYAKQRVISPSLLVLLLLLSVINVRVYLQKQAESKYTNSYNQLGNSIMEYIPRGSTVYISTIPDFYFSLKNNYKIFKAPTLHPKIDRYIKLLDESDFVVINYHIEHMFVGNVLFRYLELNTENEYTLPQTGDIPSIKIIKLNPRQNRAKP